MKSIYQYQSGTQAQRTKQPYESRPDRALLHPARNKRADWQSDFSGVVRLSVTNRLYWIKLWTNNGFRVRLSLKGGLLKTPVCRLSPVGPGRYTGELLLFEEDSSRQFLLRVWLQETGQRWLSVHFEAIRGRAEQ
jgi:hypothetical protein